MNLTTDSTITYEGRGWLSPSGRWVYIDRQELDVVDLVSDNLGHTICARTKAGVDVNIDPDLYDEYVGRWTCGNCGHRTHDLYRGRCPGCLSLGPMSPEDEASMDRWHRSQRMQYGYPPSPFSDDGLEPERQTARRRPDLYEWIAGESPEAGS